MRFIKKKTPLKQTKQKRHTKHQSLNMIIPQNETQIAFCYKFLIF